MSDKPNSLIVEGDFAKVHLELRSGGADKQPKRPGPGSMVVWGGTDPGSPWGHVLELIEKSGGQISFTQVHAAAFEEHAHELPRPGGAPGAAPMADEPTHKEEEKKEEGKVEQKPPTTAAHSAAVDHHNGPAGKGPLFDYGVEFSYQGEEAKVWAHPRAANAGPRPLIVFLHGINPKGELHSSLDNLAGRATKGTPSWIHAGKIAQKLIDDGKVTPLVIAAPTNRSGAPWDKFDLAAFVNGVEQKLREQNVEIDLDQVSLAGHSGAGGYPGRGLNKIAKAGAIFSGHKLRVFGIEDTCISSANAAEYVKGLKDANNDVTAIYAVHRHTGGWADSTYSGDGPFAKALGAANQNKSSVVGTEEMADFVSYYDNGDTKPARVSIKVDQNKLGKYRNLWQAAGGYFGNNGPHSDMVPMWCWLSLPRFYPQTEADKKLMEGWQAGANAGGNVQQGVPPPPAPKPPPGPPAVTGGDPNIPAPPPPWVNPAGDIRPKNFAPAQFADPASAVFWPVRMEKHPWKRAVHYIGEDGNTYNPNGKGGSGCHFLAGRANGRKHVGIDLNFGSLNAIVVACEAGKIVAFYTFLKTVNCIIVQHDSGLVINYGEVSPNSLKEFNLKIGDRVTAGQPIGRVGRCPEGDSMLHFETYPQGVSRNISYPAGKGADWLSNYRNPTSYLLYLAKNGR